MPSIWHLPIRHQFTALAACAAYEGTDDAQRPRLRESIAESLDALERLAEHAPANFAHRVRMIEAEVARIDGDRETAIAAFELAIAGAHGGSWINDVALAKYTGNVVLIVNVASQ